MIIQNIRNRIRKRNIIKSPLSVSIAINLLFLLLILIFCDLKYEVSDDFIMAAILSGAFGDTQNPHIVFANIILGYLLLPLYKILPQISWYFVMQIAMITISSITVTYFLFDRLERRFAYMMTTILLFFFVSDMLILVQFTKTATFAVMSGSVLFVDALYNEKKKIRIFAGGILCLFGTMLRFSTIYIAGAFLLLLLLYETICIFKKYAGKEITVRIVRIAVSGAVLIGVACGLQFVDGQAYNDETYSFYDDYNRARSHIVDSPDYGYGAYAEELEKLGISENDYYMMRTWSFADNDVFTLEKMEKTGDAIKEYKKSLGIPWEDTFENLQGREITNYPAFLACAVLLVLQIVLNQRKIWGMVSGAVVSVGLMAYFALRGRCLYRIEFSIILCLFLCGIYFWKEEQKSETNEKKEKWKTNISRFIILAVCAWNIVLFVPDISYKYVTEDDRKYYIDNVFNISWTYDARRYRRVVNKDKPTNLLLQEIEENPQNFYFLDFNTTIQNLYFEWAPWEALPAGTFDNFEYLGGVITNFPDIVGNLEEKGITNPLRSLVEDNVYLVDSKNIDSKVVYLQEHYYPNARAELYKDIGGYQIWKIYVE